MSLRSLFSQKGNIIYDIIVITEMIHGRFEGRFGLYTISVKGFPKEGGGGLSKKAYFVA